MKLLLVDPNLSLASPSMKGVVRSLPALRAAGFEIEAWCWECDDNLPLQRVVRLPRLGRMRRVGGHAFAFWARLRSWWLFTVRGEPRPDVIYTVAWYLPDCDVCHVHFSPWDWERCQGILGMRSVGDVIERAVSRWGRWSADRFLRRTTARRMIAVSDAVAGDLRRIAPALQSRLRVLPNSCDTARFNAGVRIRWRETMRTKLGFDERDRVFIFVSAGHHRRKGFFLAVDAVAQTRRCHPGARLLVVGGTEKRLRWLRSQLDAQHPGWRDWITLAGAVSDAEKYFAASDALLFPSYSEAFALVELEAAACELPLFLTRHHGSEMILDDGCNGRFVEFDAAKIAAVLAEFVTGHWIPSRPVGIPVIDAAAYAQRLVAQLVASGDAADAPGENFAATGSALPATP